MNEIQIFENNDFGKIRTLDENGTVLFCGSDVAKALGYARPNDAVLAHCRATVKRSSPISGKMQEINFITEGDVYRLIARSKLPSADKFERWVFDEVLPSICKHGAYMTTDTIRRTISDPDFLISLATTLKAEKEKNKVLTAENTGLKREVEHKENVIVGLVDDIDLATKRQRINQIVRHGVKKPALYKDRWALLYSEFEKKYHVNLSLRLENHANEYTPKLKNNMDVIDRQMGMIPNLYEIACKVFENDYDALMKEWENTIVMCEGE
jgi:prophage antirepressor-like protein